LCAATKACPGIGAVHVYGRLVWLSSRCVRTPSDQQVIPVLIYFSLTTLSTIGFGDITPITLQARYSAVAEGIAGQFYLAILVARLVGMQMSQSTGQIAEPETHDSDSKEWSG
jgi:hypothetical protein